MSSGVAAAQLSAKSKVLMRDFADEQSQLDYEASPERFFFEEGIRTWVVWNMATQARSTENTPLTSK